ncbi:hypothetical protein C2845_PM02G40710 [Panicum miliaceum]|uniref:Uncharacterized protein n=1 Tax=Panicum miliaceum TaxID=4540 RepID=A0A3L6SA23_PANMI|nr:hypothetical protein C2845_PM02G40710 [Panicum miliaceum]
MARSTRRACGQQPAARAEREGGVREQRAVPLASHRRRFENDSLSYCSDRDSSILQYGYCYVYADPAADLATMDGFQRVVSYRCIVYSATCLPATQHRARSRHGEALVRCSATRRRTRRWCGARPLAAGPEHSARRHHAPGLRRVQARGAHCPRHREHRRRAARCGRARPDPARGRPDFGAHALVMACCRCRQPYQCTHNRHPPPLALPAGLCNQSRVSSA